MLSIRLSRVGKKKQPVYRVIVLDNRKDPWGDFIENLGTYNPRKNPREINLKTDRIKYWLGVGAKPSPTVHNILIDKKIIEGEKIKATSPKKKKVDEEAKEETKTEDKPAEGSKEENKPTENDDKKEKSGEENK